MSIADRRISAGWIRDLKAPLLLLCVLLLALALGAEGCANRREAKAREAAPELRVGEGIEDTLHCDRNHCSNWYKLVVRKPMKVAITADAPADPALPDFGMALLNRDLLMLEEDRVPQRRPRKIAYKLQPGLYHLHVWGLGKDDDRLSYKLKAKREVSRASRKPRRPATRKPRTASQPKPSAPPPPPPVFIAESEVLEVERSGGEPVAVLLEAGTSQGMEPGLVGELVDGGRVIGKLEVVDVYAEGSRARIVGGLAAPITLDTSARIQGLAAERD